MLNDDVETCLEYVYETLLSVLYSAMFGPDDVSRGPRSAGELSARSGVTGELLKFLGTCKSLDSVRIYDCNVQSDAG